MKVTWCIALCLLPARQFPPVAADNTDARERTRQTLLYGIDSQVLDAIQSHQEHAGHRLYRRAAPGPQRPEVSRCPEGRLRPVQGTEDPRRGGARKGCPGRLAGDAGCSPDLSDPVPCLHRTARAWARGWLPLVDAHEQSGRSGRHPGPGIGRRQARGGGPAGVEAEEPGFPRRAKERVHPRPRRAEGPRGCGCADFHRREHGRGKGAAHVCRRFPGQDRRRAGSARAARPWSRKTTPSSVSTRPPRWRNFGLDEVFPSIIQGLRDENAKVREQSAKALARPLSASQADTAVPILSYKAEFDPEPIVRVASIKALGAIGGRLGTPKPC